MPQSTETAVASNVVRGAVETALLRQDVEIATKDVAAATPIVTQNVMSAISRSNEVALAPVVSPWTDKINVTQVVSAFIGLLVGIGLPIPDDVKVSILTLTTTLAPAVTAMMQTFWGRHVTRTSK